MREEGKRPIWQRFSAFCMIVMFFAIIAGIAVVSIITPKRTISELEKRRLADPPVLTWQSLTSGGFASSLQNYVQDHIAWRDAWIDLYSRVETLLFGKQDINGILLGRDGWMFTEHFELSDENIEQFERNLDEVERFAERYSGQVTLMLVPPAELIYTDMLPNSAPQRDLNALYEEVNRKLANTSCRIVDLREIFNQAREISSCIIKRIIIGPRMARTWRTKLFAIRMIWSHFRCRIMRARILQVSRAHIMRFLGGTRRRRTHFRIMTWTVP